MSNLSSTNAQSSNTAAMERTRYFAGQLVTAADFTRDQAYFRSKMRYHNRMLHGWGVVCGAMVRKGNKGNHELVVERGYILGPYGDEIVIHKNVTVNIQAAVSGRVFYSAGEEADPWCQNEDGKSLTDHGSYHVAIRYRECQTHPVKVVASGRGCSDSGCEYGRIQDGFEIKILAGLPDTYQGSELDPGSGGTIAYSADPSELQSRFCSECPSEPWVILADVQLDAAGSTLIEEPDNSTHRRYVISHADDYFLSATRWTTPIPGIVLDEVVPEAQPLLPPMQLTLMRRTDGSRVYLPARFQLETGETIADMLEREGNRQYRDLVNGETYTLRDLYALAGVDATAYPQSIAEALMPLQDVNLRITDLRVIRTKLGDNLDSSSLKRFNREHAGLPKAVGNLKATDLKDVKPKSTLGTWLKDMRVADVAKMPSEEFVEKALENVEGRRRREAVKRQAPKVWDRANAVMELAGSLGSK